ncbi:hypothetical protein [Nocardioides ultimimeridianus]
MLYTVRDAIDAVAGVLEADRITSAQLLDLNQLRHLLNIVYAGDDAPLHRTVIDALGSMCHRALTADQKFAVTRRDECLVAVIASVAQRHDIELSLRPLKTSQAALSRLRNLANLTSEDITDWLRTRIVNGSPDQPLTVPETHPPRRNDVVALGRPVSEADRPARERDDYLVRHLHEALVPLGAHVLAPTPNTGADEPWRTGPILRGDAAVRMGRATVYLGLGDDASSGVGAEIMIAQQLRLPVVVLKKNRRLSNRFDPDLVTLIPYGRRIQHAGQLVAEWMAASNWMLANSARRKADRELVTVRQRTLLLAAWRNSTEPQRSLISSTVRLTDAQVTASLQTAVGFELAGVGCVGDLHAALDVPLPGPIQPAPHFEDPELAAMAEACEQRQLGILDAYQAADALLIELSSLGARRGELSDAALWHRYFDQAGLDGRN